MKTIMELLLVFGTLVGGVWWYVMWLEKSSKENQRRKEMGLPDLPVQHQKLKIMVIVAAVFGFCLFLVQGSPSQEVLACDKIKQVCRYTTYNLYDKEHSIDLVLSPMTQFGYRKEQRKSSNSDDCGNDWDKKRQCYDMRYYITISSKADLQLFPETVQYNSVVDDSAGHKEKTALLNKFIQGSENTIVLQAGERTSAAITVLTFAAVFGFLGLIMWLFCRQKHQPKDVFYTSSVVGTSVVEKNEISQYRQLEFYPLYCWFYQKSKTTRIGKLMANLVPKLESLCEKYPRFFEYVFLVICSIPIKSNRRLQNDSLLGTTDMHKRNINLIEVNILISIIVAVIVLFLAVGALLSGALLKGVIEIGIVYILAGNIIYCFKKIDKEMIQMPKE